MVSSISVQVALLAFALAIVAGLHAGNGAVTVLSRALVAMCVALVVGKLAGGVVRLVLRDHLQSRKFAIDRTAAEGEAEDMRGEDGGKSQPIEAG